MTTTRSDSTALIRHDLLMQAKSISALTEAQIDTNKLVQSLVTDREVRKERDEAWNSRFATMERDIKAIKGGLVFVISIFALVFITAVANFVIKGGLDVRAGAVETIVESIKP